MKTGLKPKPPAVSEDEVNQAEHIAELERQLAQAKETERRALADYQNLVRRHQADRIRLVKMAAVELVERLVQPLDHLSLAAEQLHNQGLDMVVQQLWHSLQEAGLMEINPLGHHFDAATMEVVDKQGEGDTVIKVAQKGYTLHGELIRVAKVVVGSPIQA